MRRQHVTYWDKTGKFTMFGDRNEPREVFKFQTLIGLMLSSQTKDPVADAA